MSDSLPPTTTHHCSVCGKPSFLRCSRCLGAQYCDVSCQRKDWKSHKEACKKAEEFKKSIEEVHGPQTTAEDVDEKIVEYRLGAELGDREALFNLALSYNTGMGVAQDHDEAFQLYKKSSDLRHVLAHFKMGIAYANGHGVEKDEAEAVKWWRKAAEAGDAKSQGNLGQALQFGVGGVKIDFAESFKWYLEASKSDDIDSLFFVGFAYSDGRGISIDKGKSFTYY